MDQVDERDTVQQTMPAIVQDRYGLPSRVLTLREVPLPRVGRGEVLVQVHSSSVNAMEWHLVNGKPYLLRVAFGLRPRRSTLGADVAGTVVAVGEDVTRLAPGDHVFGEIGAGAYAGYAIAQERHLVVKPETVGFEEAAAVGVAGLTALQGLRDVLACKRGQKVLIIGASGGVGTYAVQIAKWLGAEVTAVCSTRNVAQAEELGADVVINYEREDVTRSSGRFDAIFDLVGNHPLRSCKRLTAPGGTYLMVGGPKGDWAGPLPRLLAGAVVFAFGDARVRTFVAASNADDLTQLAELMASGRLRSVIEDRIPLTDVPAALERQGRFHARAKTVVNVEGVL
ncbi:MAG TPA: NAD(P)-dependent alcohol dehydrogenase [Acidimicrobiia bacterium]|nr:NAD(P)-dependent alcohol dehydrogenase [Acidimicrobiia bacterium]